MRRDETDAFSYLSCGLLKLIPPSTFSRPKCGFGERNEDFEVEKVQKAFSRQMLNMQMSGSVKRKVKRYLENHFREEEGKKKRTGIEMATSA